MPSIIRTAPWALNWGWGKSARRIKVVTSYSTCPRYVCQGTGHENDGGGVALVLAKGFYSFFGCSHP